MLKYLQFDINKTKKSNKFKIFVISFIIIILLVYNIYINIDTKDDVKIISTNSRRIINNLNNYTETMSDFMVSNINDIELTEIQNIRLSIDYFKELKEQEIKEKELKELKELELKEFKEQELKEKELKELKEQELKELKEKAINLIKSYIPEFNSLINLVSTHKIINKYIGEVLDISCIKEIIRINSEEIFNKLINIDYDKLEVSFNFLDKNEEYYKNTDNIITTHLYTDYDKNNQYYNYSHYIYRNFKENIIKNPIYKNIKDRLEIDYSYTEPNLLIEDFSKSLNDFKQTLNINNINNPYLSIISQLYNNCIYNLNWEKYFENYTDDTYYLYYKSKYINNYGFIDFHYIEIIVINNEIIINDPNPIDIYNKNMYKNICNIPSNTKYNYRSNIHNYYSYTNSRFRNDPCYGYLCDESKNINKNNLEDTLNDNYYSGSRGTTISYNDLNDYSIEFEKNKGSRMIKHNLTNNIPDYINNNNLYIYSNYFIEKVFIDFPLISIYDEYDYIEKILNDYKIDIYNLPIIPPIKFI
jgi:hypothetical protein